MNPSYVWLLLSWLIYFLAHSVLATNSVKQLFSGISNYYRLLYSAVSIFGLVAIVGYMIFIPPVWIWEPTTLSKFFGLSLATYGVIVIKAGFKSYDLKEFLGLKQLKGFSEEHGVLQTGGILKHIRHPLYTGTMLLSWGLFIFAPHLVHLLSVVCIQVYLVIGTLLEEKKLESAFGESYRKYKKEVPMFFPKIKL